MHITAVSSSVDEVQFALLFCIARNKIQCLYLQPLIQAVDERTIHYPLANLIADGALVQDSVSGK